MTDPFYALGPGVATFAALARVDAGGVVDHVADQARQVKLRRLLAGGPVQLLAKPSGAAAWAGAGFHGGRAVLRQVSGVLVNVGGGPREGAPVRCVAARRDEVRLRRGGQQPTGEPMAQR